MIEIATKIYEVIKDYRNHDGIFLTPEKILLWANQFDADGELVLTELSNILPITYVSRSKAKELINEHILKYINKYNYTDLKTFIIETHFISTQLEYKSQPAILNLLEEVLNEKFDESYLPFVDYPKVNFIYFDDILASGSTIGKDLLVFLNQKDGKGKPFHQKLMDSEITLSISVFCIHTWGFEFLKYRIQNEFSEKLMRKINWIWDYEIQNHAKFNNQSFNIVKPIKSENIKINTYLESLSANKYEDYAYRNINQPFKEFFFTSKENRIKFENIITEKGIDLIHQIKGEIKPNIRPLGFINPAYKIFGLGTHFFTWRNIPNNSPLVYWWEVTGHNWKPLFPVANRG